MVHPAPDELSVQTINFILMKDKSRSGSEEIVDE